MRILFFYIVDELNRERDVENFINECVRSKKEGKKQEEMEGIK